MKKFRPLLLSVLSGLFLWAGWPVSPFTFFIFIAFVPLLCLEDQVNDRLKFLGWTYLTLLLWNALTTWWICNSTVPGGIAAILANSFLMCIPWLGFYNVKKRLGASIGYPALLIFWLGFEYIHLNWQLSWPWLTLGNVFASSPGWVQWYEYTGTSGGSLWILAMNILLFLAIFRKKKSGPSLVNRPMLIISIVVLTVPLVLSFMIKPEEKKAIAGTRNIVVVQPNIDPYKKFSPGSQEEQLALLIRLSESKIDANTGIVVWPETAINSSSGIDESALMQHPLLVPVWEFLSRHPQIKLYTGIEGYRLFNEQNKTPYSRLIRDSDQYYETYNTAGLLGSAGALQLYHKSKLVPGVETLPSFLRFIDSWFEQFGGTSTGYAPQEERTVLADPQSGFRIAPAICYESIYGEFLTKYIRNGANVIGIITNDGWWANTSGHKQHMQYARLRAIETRRWVVRSANTGISCYISPLGEVLDTQPWDTAACIKRDIVPFEQLSFYVLYGDIISKIALAMTVILVLISTFVWAVRKFFKNKYDEKNDPL